MRAQFLHRQEDGVFVKNFMKIVKVSKITNEFLKRNI